MIKLHCLYMQLQKSTVLGWSSVSYATEPATYDNSALSDVTKRNCYILSRVLEEKPSTQSPFKYLQYWCHSENHTKLCNNVSITEFYYIVKCIFKHWKTSASIATLKPQYRQQVLHSWTNTHAILQPLRLFGGFGTDDALWDN